MDGTLYRYILTVTQGSSRTTYLQMLKSRTKQDLDKGQLPFQDLWKLLSEAYNDDTNKYLKTLGDADNIYSIYANEDEPSNFDTSVMRICQLSILMLIIGMGNVDEI